MAKILSLLFLPVLVISGLQIFYKVPSKGPTVVKYKRSFMAETIVQCTRACNCHMFHYNSANKMCYVLDLWHNTVTITGAGTAGGTGDDGDPGIIDETGGDYLDPANDALNDTIDDVTGDITVDGYYADYTQDPCQGPNYYLMVSEGRCLWISQEWYTWNDAKINCNNKSWKLLQFQSGDTWKQKIQFLINLNLSHLPGFAWIGGSDIETEGNWTWLDGSAIQKEGWYGHEPNDAGENEDCLSVYTNYNFTWNDFNCEQKTIFICEFIVKSSELKEKSTEIKLDIPTPIY